MQDQRELRLKLVQKLSLCIVILVDLIQQYDLGQTYIPGRGYTSMWTPLYYVKAATWFNVCLP